MFLEKIIHIKGIGNYEDFTAGRNKNWNGVLAKNTLIYADNASGKTTLAQIVKSLSKSSDIEDFRKRRTFNYTSTPSIKVLVNDEIKTQIVEFNGSEWSSQYNNIIVFDTYFVERNIYILSPSKKTGDADTIKVLLGEECLDIYDKIAKLKMQLSGLTGTKGYLVQTKNRIETFRQLGKIARPVFYPNEKLTIEEVEEKIQDINKKIDQVQKERNRLRERLNSNTYSKQYVETTNKYLALFSTDIRLSALYMKTKSTITYGVEIKGQTIRSNSENTSLKRILSDGEKNVLAFSFFLAKLELLKDIDKYIVVFDDPLSSMDADRRYTSICQLCSFAGKVSQFILLSHDKLLVRDVILTAKRLKLCGQNDEKLKTLKISKTINGSVISDYDVEADTKTGLAKDLERLIDYSNLAELSKYDINSVAESIRRVLEGFLRLKYSSKSSFYQIKTLGAMIDEIEKGEDAIFAYDKENIKELKEINFYSSCFHHSNPSQESEMINSSELAKYCQRTLKLLLHI